MAGGRYFKEHIEPPSEGITVGCKTSFSSEATFAYSDKMASEDGPDGYLRVSHDSDVDRAAHAVIKIKDKRCRVLL